MGYWVNLENNAESSAHGGRACKGSEGSKDSVRAAGMTLLIN